jgi:hypothetical protein
MPAAAARRSGRGSMRMSGGRSGMFPPCPPMLGEGAGGKHWFFGVERMAIVGVHRRMPHP